jgi:hypothetical protein
VTLLGETFLRCTSDYGYPPAKVVWVIAFVIAVGAASLQVAQTHKLVVFESLQTEGVAVFNTVQDSERVPGEDLSLDPLLLAVDGFIPLIEVGYASEWSIADWREGDDAGAAAPGSAGRENWSKAVRSFMAIDLAAAAAHPFLSPAFLMAVFAELLRFPLAIAAWVIGFAVAAVQAVLTWGSAGLDPSTLVTDVRAVWTGMNPENTLRWLGAIYHGLGWALISMAIVTFTGVMRRD